MQIIKKYANRKLYHTNRKQYITLEGIAQLVQNGETVQVLDNEKGADITASILAQIVLHTQNQSGSLLPTTILTSLIQAGGDALANFRQALFASLGGMDIIDREIERRIDVLIEDNTLSAEEGARIWRLLTRCDLTQSTEAHEIEVPSRNDVARLHNQVDALAAMVEQLLQQNAALTLSKS